MERNTESLGYCGVPDKLIVARAALHFYEEPCISAKEGSGAVFFSGCNMRCIFCQNRDIALNKAGKIISVTRLAEIFLELQEKKANNINLVTPSHYVPEIIKAVEKSRNQGLKIPIVYNTSSYEHVDTIKQLEGIVDVYLPDMKYMDENLAQCLSNARDYPGIAIAAISEMIRQQNQNVFDENSLIKRGVIIRHLIMPGNTKNSLMVIDKLVETFGNDIYLSIMNQYTPVKNDYEIKELNRKVTAREYNKVIDYAINKGIKNGFYQDGNTAMESFIPAFDNEGV